MVRTAFLFVALALGSAAAGTASTQNDAADARLATVAVTVVDDANRPITNLSAADFLILEDGEARSIQSFRYTETPASILLLVDRSVSMQAHWPLLHPALMRFLDSLKPHDRVSIALFDERSKEPDVVLDWRQVETGKTEFVSLDPVIRGHQYFRMQMAPGGSGYVRYPTKDFYGALDWAVQRLATVSGRKGVVVFTDGHQPDAPTRRFTLEDVRYTRLADIKDDNRFQKIRAAVQASETRFDFVAVNTDLNPTGGDSGGIYSLFLGMSRRSRLEELAEVSGGRVVFPKRLEDTLQLYEDLGRDFGAWYTLGYFPAAAPPNGAARRIEVRTTRPGLRVRLSLRDGLAPPQ